MKTKSVQRMTSAALLTALGIIIPMFSPLKVVIGPASFTLASHVPIFMAMFISPPTALFVTLGTALGFFFGGFTLSIVLRAASHVVFVAIGSYVLQRYPEITQSAVKLRVFSFLIGVVHSLCEVVVVSFFYFGGSVPETYYQNGFLYSVLLLVGVGGLIHSMVDLEIAWLLTKAVCRKPEIASMFGNLTLENSAKPAQANR